MRIDRQHRLWKAHAREVKRFKRRVPAEQARVECVECGFEDNADVVGAINVLRAGHARFACEVSGEVMPPAAGTHRSDSGAAQCRS